MQQIEILYLYICLGPKKKDIYNKGIEKIDLSMFIVIDTWGNFCFSHGQIQQFNGIWILVSFNKKENINEIFIPLSAGFLHM